MFFYSLSLDATHLVNTRAHLSEIFPAVKRSHLAESVAYALGFNTSIALQTFIRFNPIGERRYEYFDSRAFFARLFELGYADMQGWYVKYLDLKFTKSMALNFVVASNGIAHSTSSLIGESFTRKDSPSRGMVDLCKSVLSHIQSFRKNPGPTSSYGFKHRIEEAFGTYVTNGAVIQAALELDLPFKTFTDDPNVDFYISDKVFDAAVRKEKLRLALSDVSASVLRMTSGL